MRLLLLCAIAWGSWLSPLRADDEEVLKQNGRLVRENREIATQILKLLEVPTSPVMPEAKGTTLENNQVVFLLNNFTFKLIAAKVGAKPIAASVVPGTLDEQNHAILLENRMVIRSIAEKLEIKLPESDPLKGSLATKNNTILTANRVTLGLILKSLKK
jgi:hypothetical protein